MSLNEESLKIQVKTTMCVVALAEPVVVRFPANNCATITLFEFTPIIANTSLLSVLPQMFRAAVLALCVASASAFLAPSNAPTTTVAVSFFGGAKKQAKAPPKPLLPSFDDELGVQAPLGFWDPLGMLTGVDQDRFDRLRGVELKHGRISMLAFLGHVVTSNGVRLPGNLATGIKFSDVDSGLAAFKTLPPLGTFQIIAFIGWLEVFVMRDVTGEAEFVGDFRNGFIDFGWDKFDEETK